MGHYSLYLFPLSSTCLKGELTFLSPPVYEELWPSRIHPRNTSNVELSLCFVMFPNISGSTHCQRELSVLSQPFFFSPSILFVGTCHSQEVGSDSHDGCNSQLLEFCQV